MILNIIVFAVFILFIILGVKRGLVHSALKFIGTIAAACLSTLIGGALAKTIYSSLFRPAIVQQITKSIGGITTGNEVYAPFSVLPDFIVSALEMQGITSTSLQASLDGQIGKAPEIIADAAAPVFISIVKIMTVSLLFFIFLIILRIVIKMVASLFKFPVLSQINALLGGVFNMLTAFVFIWAVFSLVNVLIPIMPDTLQTTVQTTINESAVAGWFAKFNPLQMMFKA